MKSKLIKRASSRGTLPSGFPTKRVSNQSPQLQRLGRKLKFHLYQVYMILSIERITKTLISLCGCADWSAPVLFLYPRRQDFSRCDPKNKLNKCKRKSHIEVNMEIFFEKMVKISWLPSKKESNMWGTIFCNFPVISRNT